MMRITCPVCGERFGVRGRRPIKEEDISEFTRLMKNLMKKFFLNTYKYSRVPPKGY